MQKNHVCREARFAELDEIIRLNHLAYSTFKDELTPENWQLMEKNLQNRPAIEALFLASQCFVCQENGKLAGAVFLVPAGVPVKEYPREWAYIRSLGVLPESRNKGIARALMEKCIQAAKNNGEKTIGLHTSELMNDARHLYEDMGFEVIKQLPDRFGIRYWLYKKIL